MYNLKNVKIKMIETRRGMRNGLQPFKYEAGEECSVPASLAESYIAQGIATLVDEALLKPKRKKKVI